MTGTARSGFSLLELAVVLTILSLIVAFGLDIGRNAITGSERLGTQEKLALIKRALDQYASMNGYLPCPASPEATPGASWYSAERRASPAGAGCLGGGSGVIVVSSNYIGMLPARNIGLPENYTYDSWGNKLLYAVSVDHVGAVPGAGVRSYQDNTGAITIRTGTPNGVSYPITTDYQGVNGRGATYVVISAGPNGRGAYPLNSSSIVFPCGTGDSPEQVNCSRNDSVYYDSDYNDGDPQSDRFFDDYIVWGSNSTQHVPDTTFPAASCPSGCEPWCATCSVTSGSPGSKVTCAKIITSTSPCHALCIQATSRAWCP